MLGFWYVVASLSCLRWTAAIDGLECPKDMTNGKHHCTWNWSQDNTHTFSVDDNILSVTIEKDQNFWLRCEGKLRLDSPAMPHFPNTRRFLNVKFVYCTLPAQSYLKTLAAINVTVLKHLEVEDEGEITARHLSGLECTTDATFRCDSHLLQALALVKLRLSLDVFEAVPNLLQLRLEETKFNRLDLLPQSLTELHLVNAGIHHLPRSIFSRFKNLVSLSVRDDDGSVRMEAMPSSIEKLSLMAQVVYIDNASIPAPLKELKLIGWNERIPKSLKSCGALEFFSLENITAEILPDDWLIGCRSLVMLSLEDASSLTNVSKYAMRGARALTTLELKGTALKSLPLGLLDDATNLTSVTLSNNNLQNLPPSLFARTMVHSLDLSYNKLKGEVFSSLGALESLWELDLSHNPELGDACADNANDRTRISKLNNLHKLQKLLLTNTNATMICRDWRTDMPYLTQLDLTENHITSLTFDDTQFKGEVEVSLSDNPVRSLRYTRQEYQNMLHKYSEYCRIGGRYVSHARISLTSTLNCDCNVLWAARTLQNCSGNVILNAQCPGKLALINMPLQNLTCQVDCGLSADCHCFRRDGDVGEILRVSCVNRTTVPRLPDKSGVIWELSVPNNNIAELKASELPPNLHELDLRQNKLTHLSAEVLRILPRGARLSLHGNPLRCDCKTADILVKLITDVPHLSPPFCRPCPPVTSIFANYTILISLLVPLIVAVGAVILCLSYSRTKFRIKKYIRDLFCPRPEPSNDLPYDVFLSYSHLDGDLVEELMEWLEKNEYRVCEHSRDWIPGGWIPAQIAASVEKSRCTLVVVSKNFLHSKWARAEFREAYVAALHDTHPRLVVVLLEEPAVLPLDKELRRYLQNNTYALWTDRYFWSKLRAALPKPRPGEIIPIESELTPTLDKEAVP